MFNILVVDDQAHIRRLYEYTLEKNGYQPFTAGDGAEALRLMENTHIDLVILDLMMPTMDGLRAAKEIRALPRADAQSVAIIAVTANAFSDDIRQAIAAGMNEHIGKPVDSDKLVEMLLKYKKSK